MLQDQIIILLQTRYTQATTTYRKSPITEHISLLNYSVPPE